jgi:ligand-binding sensor domain-containing protein
MQNWQRRVIGAAVRWQSCMVVLCVLTYGGSQGFGEDPSSIASEYIRTDFTFEDGLPDNTVNAMTQTGNGLLWVGTGSGLASFDGKTFTPVPLRIPGAAPPGAITSLEVGSDGDLWVGSDAGIVRIPKSELNDSYVTASTAYRLGKELSDEIEVLFRARDGVIWAGTNHGLYHFEGRQFVSALSSVFVNRIEQSPDGRLLVTTDRGVVELDGLRVTRYPGLGAKLGVADNQIYDAFEYTEGTIWYCTDKGVRP